MSYDAATNVGVSYLDGVEMAREDLKVRQPTLDLSRIVPSERPLTIGKGVQPFAGLIDSVYVYDRVLSGDEIKRLMQEDSVPGARLAWLFNETDATVIRDSSGHGFDGRFVSEKLDPNAEQPSQLAVPVIASEAGLTAFTAPATTKVFRKSAPVDSQTVTAPVSAIEAAANEYESFQLVLRPEQEMSVTTLEASDLTTPEGARIPREQIHIATVGYVPLDQPSQTTTAGTEVKGEAAVMFEEVSARPGFYPDPLPALELPLRLEAQISQPLWVTLQVPENAPAGVYHGTISVTRADGTVTKLPYGVKVWDFALPRKFHTDNSGFFTKRNQEAKEKIYRVFDSHYVSPAPLFAKPEVTLLADGGMEIDTAEFDQEAAAMLAYDHLNVLYFPGFDCYSIDKAVAMSDPKVLWNGVRISETPGELTPEFKRVFKLYLKKMSDHLREKNWFDRSRFMVVDEPGTPEDFALCREFYELITQTEPDLPVMITKWPTPESAGGGNVWCLGFFQQQRMEEARAKGDKLEWYPNWHVFIDRPVMDTRMIAYTMWKFDLTGILLWRVDHGWGVSNRNVWRNPSYVYPDGRTLWGSGLLLYPDADYNPVSSIRFEALRDAFEDYEYLYMLNELIVDLETAGGEDRERLEMARRVLEESVNRIVFRYEAHAEENRWLGLRWETADTVLYDVRRQLATTIEKLKIKN